MHECDGRAFSPEDLYRHQSISDCEASPSEPLVACTVESIDRTSESYQSQIWAFPLDGGQPWQFTTGGSTNSSPHWSPDGSTLAFISDRAGTAQVFCMRRQGGEASQLGRVQGTAVDFAWSPGGRQLAAVFSLAVDPNLRGQRAPAGSKPPEADAPQLAWKLPYKLDGSGFDLGHEAHLFEIDAATGDHRQITDGPFNVRAVAWSPSGDRIAYVRTREGDESHRTDIWLSNPDGTGARRLTTQQAQTLYPVWSPDGRWIVFSGAVDEGDAQTRLWLIELSTGAVRPLGDETIEISTEGMSVQFADGDSSHLWAVLARRGRQHVVRIALPSGEIEAVAKGDRHASTLAVAKDWLVFASETSTSAVELHACKRDGSGERRLSAINAWWEERAAGVLVHRTFRLPDGNGGTEPVEGWLIRPKDAGDRPTPLLVDLHGGPASYVVFDYPPVAYWSVLWSRGWSILALNAVGSASFGREFCDRLCGRWGELDLPQHLGAAEQLKREGLVDDRWAVIGKSYGGYLSAWAIGHTQAFKAAVVIAPVSNIETHYGSSDSGYYADPYTLEGDRTTNRETMRRLSPTQKAESARTPTLILQGELDERCPKTQSEELFVSLRRGANPPCEMVLYPGGSHMFTSTGKPPHRLDAVVRIVEWVERHASRA